MYPHEARKELINFLQEETSIEEKILYELARTQIEKIRKTQGKQEDVSEEELLAYIENHYEELKKKTDIALTDICKKVIPTCSWTFLIKPIGIYALCLVPSIALLTKEICVRLGLLLSQEESNYEPIFALLCLLILLIISAVSLILDGKRH
jgi:hypothetical protein